MQSRTGGPQAHPGRPVGRIDQILLVVSTVLFSWLAMQAVHELGHVLHTWLSGGTVMRVVLHPLDLSRTDVGPNPHPLFVAWGGAVWGCLIPLLGLGVARWVKWRSWYLPAFFAGFCLIANGAYLGAGSWTGAGDAGDLLRHGAPQWTLIVFGVVTSAMGLGLWHGLGPHFGLASAHGRVDHRAALAVTGLLLLLLTAELLLAVQ